MRQIVWDSKMVEMVAEQIHNGFVPKRLDNPFFEGVVGLRRPGLAFKMTNEEIDEYIKSKKDIHYFAENYCWIKGEQGEQVKLSLRDYQTEILDNFFKYRFNILMASRQVGKCLSFNTIVSIEIDGVYYDIRFGKLYYMMILQNRKLTFLEKIKIKLYDFIYYLENT